MLLSIGGIRGWSSLHLETNRSCSLGAACFLIQLWQHSAVCTCLQRGSPAECSPHHPPVCWNVEPRCCHLQVSTDSTCLQRGSPAECRSHHPPVCWNVESRCCHLQVSTDSTCLQRGSPAKCRSHHPPVCWNVEPPCSHLQVRSPSSNTTYINVGSWLDDHWSMLNR